MSNAEKMSNVHGEIQKKVRFEDGEQGDLPLISSDLVSCCTYEQPKFEIKYAVKQAEIVYKNKIGEKHMEQRGIYYPQYNTSNITKEHVKHIDTRNKSLCCKIYFCVTAVIALSVAVGIACVVFMDD